MRAAIFHAFNEALSVQTVPDPTPSPDGVVLQVEACGICRSDWHGWVGHDSDITPPHVPGHELAGVVAEVGAEVKRWRVGDRVTIPFAGGCGTCPQCIGGQQQICDHDYQPGFSGWGGFAEYVALRYADVNLVALPQTLDSVTAASLGCRFITSFRAVVDQGKVSAGQWVAVYGCGGVGLSAVMIAAALGANVLAIDIDDAKLKLAQEIGATQSLNALSLRQDELIKAVHDLTHGGAHVSLDALGSAQTCYNSVMSLRKRGKHIQVGLMYRENQNAPLNMARVLAWELEIMGSHGMQAHRYDAMLRMIETGKLQPERLIGKRVRLEEAGAELAAMGDYQTLGISVIDRF